MNPKKLSRIRANAGRIGGRSTSEAKAAAARLNGLKGGPKAMAACPPDNWQEPHVTDHLLMVQTTRHTPVNVTVRVEKDFRSDAWQEPTINCSSTSGSQPIFVAEQISNLMLQAIEWSARLEAMAGKDNRKTLRRLGRALKEAK
jgi:hypothetical protein